MLAAVAAVRQQEAGLCRVAELGIQYPLELLAQARVMDRAGNFHPAVQISRHKIGR